LRRPRRRVYPQKPKVGIRASAPNEIWHLDTTVVRLIDGTCTYLHAVIDIFSRRVLAWKVSERFEPANTVAILIEATLRRGPTDTPPTFLAHGVLKTSTRVSMTSSARVSFGASWP
jgi:transposase InsO family protein